MKLSEKPILEQFPQLKNYSLLSSQEDSVLRYVVIFISKDNPIIDYKKRKEDALKKSGIKGDFAKDIFNDNNVDVLRCELLYAGYVGGFQWQSWVSQYKYLQQIIYEVAAPVTGAELGDDKRLKCYETKEKCRTYIDATIRKMTELEIDLFGDNLELRTRLVKQLAVEDEGLLTGGDSSAENYAGHGSVE